jgi:EAL domain-containing protein (putative c-di-GMP-specific phosphodiesterase class I)
VRVPVAVNLSNLQFQALGFVETVERALAEAGAAASMLELELTERMLMDDLPAVQAALHRLKAMGVGIAVDDFGTGYSSLGHLKDLPLDRLKIDRSASCRTCRATAAPRPSPTAIVQMGRSAGPAGGGRRRGNDGAEPVAARARLRCAAGLSVRRADVRCGF